MPGSSCSCQCKICRAPGGGHCRSGCCHVPASSTPATLSGHADRREVAEALKGLKAGSGSHSPSVAEIERALPGVVRVDACFLSNPYATDEVMRRLLALPAPAVERMVSHYPSQSGAIASLLAPSAGVPAEQIVAANGACEVIGELLAGARGALLLPLPTFSAYYEFASGPVAPHPLDPRADFRLDLGQLEERIDREDIDTVVIINPNNPDGGLTAHHELVAFVERVQGRVRQVIVDESFGAFTGEAPPTTLAPLVGALPHLVVVNSLSKSHGIPGLRLGYAVMAPPRAREIRSSRLWNLNAFAEWFCGLLTDPDYARAYDSARRRYVRHSRALFDALADLPGVRAFPTSANFVLLELDRPASDVASRLLARHGVYVRDCGDKWGLEGARYLRVAARSAVENRRILQALSEVMSETPLAAAA